MRSNELSGFLPRLSLFLLHCEHVCDSSIIQQYIIDIDFLILISKICLIEGCRISSVREFNFSCLFLSPLSYNLRKWHLMQPETKTLMKQWQQSNSNEKYVRMKGNNLQGWLLRLNYWGRNEYLVKIEGLAELYDQLGHTMFPSKIVLWVQ